MKILLKVLFLIFLVSDSVSATPIVNVETKYYKIYGATADVLRKEMNTKSPVRQSGNTYDAYTSWYVNWHFNWNISKRHCHMTTVTSSVDVEFTLPKWMNRNESNNDLKNKWDRYYSALIDHENGHKNFGINAANEIEEQLSGLPSSSSCALLKQKANTLGKEILDKYRTNEKKYDRNSNHGVNNGAKFP